MERRRLKTASMSDLEGPLDSAICFSKERRRQSFSDSSSYRRQHGTKQQTIAVFWSRVRIDFNKEADRYLKISSINSHNRLSTIVHLADFLFSSLFFKLNLIKVN